jgi:hypothetical protein
LIGKYAKDQISEIKAVRGKKQNSLSVTLLFLLPGVVKVDMTLYVSKMLKDFPEKFSGKTKWS